MPRSAASFLAYGEALTRPLAAGAGVEAALGVGGTAATGGGDGAAGAGGGGGGVEAAGLEAAGALSPSVGVKLAKAATSSSLGTIIHKS